LVDAMIAPGASYRSQLGAVAALTLMGPQTKLPPLGSEAVVRLLGHPDATIRTTAATFLGRLVEPSTLTHAKVVLLGQVGEATDGNLVYNSIYVLGSWLQRGDLDPNLRGEIAQGLNDVRPKLASAPGWGKSLSLLDGYLPPR
jgi:hypothetical protein